VTPRLAVKGDEDKTITAGDCRVAVALADA
jgi:hypothetical protein